MANTLGIDVPQQMGIFGFANETFTELIRPALSSVNQKSKELGKCAANLYFENILPGKPVIETSKKIIIKSEIIIRQSSSRSHLFVNH